MFWYSGVGFYRVGDQIILMHVLIRHRLKCTICHLLCVICKIHISIKNSKESIHEPKSLKGVALIATINVHAPSLLIRFFKNPFQ